MIFTVINTIHSFWKSSSPTLLWPPARILSLFTTTTALWEGRELWCVLRETPNWTKLEFKTAFILECLWLLSGQDQYAWSLSRWGSGKGKQCDWRVCQALLKATHCFRSLGTFWKMIFLKKKKQQKQETFTDRVTTVILLNITAMIYPRPFKLFIHPPMFSDSSDKVEEPCSRLGRRPS